MLMTTVKTAQLQHKVAIMTGRIELNDQCLNARGKDASIESVLLVTAVLYLALASLCILPLFLSANVPVLFQHLDLSD